MTKNKITQLEKFIYLYYYITGCAAGALELCTCSIVQQSFPHNRGLATGISTLGYTAGTVLSPILVEYLLQAYGLSGALLIQGAIFVQGIAFAAFMRSPSEFIQRNKIDNMNEIFSHMVDVSVFRDPSFVVCIMHKLFLVTCRIGLLAHTVSAALKQGVNEKSAAYLLTIMGLCNFVTRVLSSILMNIRGVDPLAYNSVGTLCIAGAAMFAAFADRYELFVVSMIFLGCCEGENISNI